MKESALLKDSLYYYTFPSRVLWCPWRGFGLDLIAFVQRDENGVAWSIVFLQIFELLGLIFLLYFVLY